MFISVNLPQPSKKNPNEVTKEVLKLVNIIEVKLPQKLNIPYIFLTFEVSKLDKSKYNKL